MAAVSCEKYPLNTYCTCENDNTTDNEHFKQFDQGSQKFICCDNLTNISLSDLKKYNTTTDRVDWSTTKEFFETIESEGITGCDFTKYYVGSTSADQENYFINNYNDIYESVRTVSRLYNEFLSEKPLPVSNGHNVSCSSGFYPYILSYRSPGDVYYNFSYICSENSNGVFNVITLPYGKVDYKVHRFFDNSTKQLCTSSTCPVLTEELGSFYNQGNKNHVYNNSSSGNKTGFLVSVVFSVLFLLVAVIILMRSLHYFKD